MSGHQVKKVKQIFFRDLELRYMFLGQIFAKNAKNDPRTLFEASKSVKNKIRKITVKSRNDVKSACFLYPFPIIRRQECPIPFPCDPFTLNTSVHKCL